jgi:hypothetical protein
MLFIAYRVFHKAIMYIMDSQPVSYRAYGAVAFQTGTAGSMFTFVRAFFDDRFKMNRRAYKFYTTIALSTIYIVAMPTLFSAMTGYAAIATPSVQIPPAPYNIGSYECADLGGRTLERCGNDGLQAGWGVCVDSMRFNYGSPLAISIDATGDLLVVKKYYETYQVEYDAALSDPRFSVISALDDCPPLTKTSQLTFDENFVINLSSPMLNIQLWDKVSHLPNVWICNGLILNTHDFGYHGLPSGNLTGSCSGGSEYEWGFSYVMLLIVCILNLIFATMMYELWLEAHRNGTVNMFKERERIKYNAQNQIQSREYIHEEENPSILKDAVLIASYAEQQYGQDIKVWSSSKLRKSYGMVGKGYSRSWIKI